MRIPVTRELADGTIQDGTCAYEESRYFDFRDLDGNEWNLPPGASFNIPLQENL